MNLKKTMKLAEEYRAWRRGEIPPSKKGDSIRWVHVRKEAYGTMLDHAYEQFPKLVAVLKMAHDCGKGDCRKCNSVQLALIEAEKSDK